MPSADPLADVPDGLLPAVHAGLAAIDGVPVEKVVAMFRAAIDQRLVVPRSDYDDVDQALREANGRLSRIAMQMEAVGNKRAELENLCHALADSLQGAPGGDEALARYRATEW